MWKSLVHSSGGRPRYVSEISSGPVRWNTDSVGVSRNSHMPTGCGGERTRPVPTGELIAELSKLSAVHPGVMADR